MNIDELTIGEARKITSMFSQQLEPCATQRVQSNLDDFAIGQTVIIRTYSAGVWFGELDKKAGNEVILKNARRMWQWKCAESISLSGIVKYGIDRSGSRIAPAIDAVWLQAIEIMPITGKAAQSIAEAENAEAR